MRGWRKKSTRAVVRKLGDGLFGSAMVVVVAGGAGCSAIYCPPVATSPEDLLLQVVHIEASDAPMAWALNVYPDGVLELQKFGRRRRCSRVSARELQKLKGLLEGAEFEESPEFDGPVGHEEWLRVVTPAGAVRGFLGDEIPPGVRPVFAELDWLFWSKFGQHYHWLLLGPDEGP